MKVKIFLAFLFMNLLSSAVMYSLDIFPQGYYSKSHSKWCKPIRETSYIFNDAYAKLPDRTWAPYYLGLRDCFYIPCPIEKPEIYTVSCGYVKINRNSVSLNENGFKEFILNGKNCACIDGGGFFAANVPYMYKSSFGLGKDYYREFMLDGKKYIYSEDHDTIELEACCRLHRSYYLSQNEEEKSKEYIPFNYKGPYEEFIDEYGFMANVVKSVKLSVPYLEEDLNGKHIVYDDEMLFLRWFICFFHCEGQDIVNYINCTKPMVEGDAGNGTGISYDIEFYLPASNLIVLNGYVDWNKQSLYKKNARMKKVKVEGDGFSITYDFEDYVHFSRIDFPKEVSRVKLTVLEVYDGSRWSDLAVSGFWVNTKKPDPRDVGNYKYVEMADESILRREKEKKKAEVGKKK